MVPRLENVATLNAERMLPVATEGVGEQVLQVYRVGQQASDILVAAVKEQHGDDVSDC